MRASHLPSILALTAAQAAERRQPLTKRDLHAQPADTGSGTPASVPATDGALCPNPPQYQSQEGR